MKNILIVEGNLREENENFSKVGIQTHTESLKDSLNYFTDELKFDVVNPSSDQNIQFISDKLQNYDGLIWGGSSLNIYNDTPEIRKQIEFMKDCQKKVKKILAICWGMQVAVTAAGGQVKKANNSHIGIANEIQLNEKSNLEYISEEIYLNSPSEFDVITTKEKYFSVYEWIDLFDKNIYAIIFIMIVVASINIISVLVVLILERTNMIGVLKALGITNFSLQKFFIYISSYLIFIGIVIGNIFGLMILFIQEKYKIISLDPKIYYVDSVPIHIELSHIISLNLIAFILCVLSIFIPSLLVSRINPKDSIKFN